MSEMVDRIARAIYAASQEEYERVFPGRLKLESWEESQSDPRSAGLAFAQARAAIEAMRDVDSGSPAMLLAGKKSLYSLAEDPEIEHARKCWHAMCDEALK